ncbi:GAF domain-containing sensor histidine kinase [Gloeocapsa sp. PCC 73106]|uniref:GAF domain-containing sensor histidine kinase n=1 Tax=Gloeocapsa sp. PCC 73106 TaxID=102232 RepID=UPI0002ABC7EB|nr:GAF domain-containing sensor histidine kinase [Gloeocapsa sp. PCC 73106]ELR96886.1 signal transduction histidine kinase [Gloeocapsa sp. PCC 73106]
MEFVTRLEEFGDDILRLLTNDLDAENLLSIISLKIAENLVADACLIIATPDQSWVKSGYWSKQQELLIPNIYEYVKKIKTTSKAIAMNQDPQVQNLAKRLGWSSILILHTYYQEKANGLIAVGCFQPHEWSLSVKNRITKMAPLVSVAIAYQQSHQQQKKQSQYQSFLINLNREIERTSQLSIILRLSLTGLGACLKIDQGLILRLKYLDPFFLDHEQIKITQAEVEIVSQWSPEYLVSSIKKAFDFHSSPLFQRVWLNSPKPLAINSLTELEQMGIGPKDLDTLRLHMFPSILIVPLLTTHIKSTRQEVILGFIVLQKRQFRLWQNDEIKLVQAVAIQLSMAMIQNQTLRQVQSLVEERTSQLKWSLDMQGKLFTKMRLQLAELKRLNQIKDEFIARLSDELRLPLANMKMAITMLKLNQSQDKNQVYLNILEKECNKETKLISDLLTLQQIKKAQLEFHYESIDINQIIEETSHIFKQNWQHKKLNLVINYPNNLPLIIYSDRDSLLCIFTELLNNSGKFSLPNTTVTLSIKQITDLDKTMVVIKVTNLGREINQTDKTHIFQPFYRGENSYTGSAQGTGLGLFLVKSIVEHLNGKIEVNNQPTEVNSVYLTFFTITLPYLIETSQLL